MYKMPYGGEGGRKVPNRCHVLFEWPLHACLNLIRLYSQLGHENNRSLHLENHITSSNLRTSIRRRHMEINEVLKILTK